MAAQPERETFHAGIGLLQHPCSLQEDADSRAKERDLQQDNSVDIGDSSLRDCNHKFDIHMGYDEKVSERRTWSESQQSSRGQKWIGTQTKPR